ncbi:gamma carbonic anhydrase family protein [Candidatus Methylocalor cossyra]|uniref:Protein YrdA n=1 Tax=Candidatus Methylocalor cossyra TaxID=3108543 RepID=A0ABM9NMF3_9GAMM
MALQAFNGIEPRLGAGVYLADSALVIGDVTLGRDVSVWPFTVLRGDVHRIEIGDETNIQDGCVLHVTHRSATNPEGHPLRVGRGVTVGHRVVLHGCTVGDLCLIGIGAIILDGAVVEDRVMVGAGALVPSGKRLESGFLYLGSPARPVRALKDEELEYLSYSRDGYVRLKNQYLRGS